MALRPRPSGVVERGIAIGYVGHLDVLSSLTPGQAIAVETVDGNRVEGSFDSFRGEVLVIRLGLVDRLFLAREIERVIVPPEPK